MIQSKRLPYFSHLDTHGKVRMVDVSLKKCTERTARASARIRLSDFTLSKIKTMEISKGDVLTTAKLAGILGAKKVAEIIPLAHPIPISLCEINFKIEKPYVLIFSTVKTQALTGVEMEALTAVSIAALTIYDMVKAVDRAAVIERIQLEEKSGGKSGHYKRN